MADDGNTYVIPPKPRAPSSIALRSTSIVLALLGLVATACGSITAALALGGLALAVNALDLVFGLLARRGESPPMRK
ncbi:MAG TPA: hypothetical protein VOA87_11165 [Thermoanaerobaculia bacterium]|nr:hypothetical protein [Thermoanaerobaculia bacterium]